MHGRETTVQPFICRFQSPCVVSDFWQFNTSVSDHTWNHLGAWKNFDLLTPRWQRRENIFWWYCWRFLMWMPCLEIFRRTSELTRTLMPPNFQGTLACQFVFLFARGNSGFALVISLISTSALLFSDWGNVFALACLQPPCPSWRKALTTAKMPLHSMKNPHCYENRSILSAERCFGVKQTSSRLHPGTHRAAEVRMLVRLTPTFLIFKIMRWCAFQWNKHLHKRHEKNLSTSVFGILDRVQIPRTAETMEDFGDGKRSPSIIEKDAGRLETFN